MNRVSRYFLNGVIVLIPIAITAFVVVQVFIFTEWLVGRFLPTFLRFPGMALLVMLVALVFVVASRITVPRWEQASEQVESAILA